MDLWTTTRRRPDPVAVLACLLGTALAATSPAQDLPRGDAGLASGVRPFLQAHCTKCHGEARAKGGLTVHDLPADLGADLERWAHVLDALEDGVMPPAGQKQPNDADRGSIVRWLDSELKSAIRDSGTPAPATTRRLTNFEYQNTLRDLIGFELRLADNLPEDPVKPYHFNNTATFMLLGMEQLDRYKENARRVMASAIVDPGEPEVHKTKRDFAPRDPAERGMQLDEIGVYGNRRHSAAWGMGLRSWPETGEFRVRVKAAAILPPGFREAELRLVMGQDLNVNSSARQIHPVGSVALTNTVDESQVFELRGRIENHPELQGRVTDRGRTPPTMAITPQNLYDDGRLNDHLDPLTVPRVVVQSIEFEAPVTDTWPPDHHRRILFDSPLRESDPSAYVREVIRRFATRAFRRPVTDEELDRFCRMYSVFATDLPALEHAMRETLAMVLIAPAFLQHTSAPEAPNASHHDLASRLAYFLWGTMPDEELSSFAREGSLDDPEILESQTLRLLDDAKSGDFIHNFTTQWLSIEKAKAVKINAALFPRFLYRVSAGERRGTEVPYRPTIRDYMHAETVGYVAQLIRRNAPVSQLVDSDFAYVNQPLAAHYGIDGVQGNALRPVPLQPGHHLGGLLTQGSVLVANSTGSAPHPIYRAVWIREAILGEEVPPPPPEVPALVDSAGDDAESAVTIKDLLRKHRDSQSCRDCHERLDPWGIPFEHYNSVGRFQPRVPQNGVRVKGFDQRRDGTFEDYVAYVQALNTVPVDASARLPDGSSIDGMRDLKTYLLEHRLDDIAENVLRRLLSYGLGRELTVHDRYAVADLMEQSRRNGHRLRDMIVTICTSPMFRGASGPAGK